MKRGRKPIDPKITEEKINNAFKETCMLVSKGLTIREALKFIKIDNRWFYKHLSEKQLLELKQVKTANTIYGVGAIFKK
jgi:type II secretory pathway component PulF